MASTREGTFRSPERSFRVRPSRLRHLRHPARWLHDRFGPGAYDGAAAGLLPLDFATSWLAKRSLYGYGIWRAYFERTSPAFENGEGSSASYDPTVLNDLRRDGCAVVSGSVNATDVVEMREFALDRHKRARSLIEKEDPAGSKPYVHVTDEDGLNFFYARRTGRCRIHFERLDTYRGRDPLPRLVQTFADTPSHCALAEAYFGTRRVQRRTPLFMVEVLEPAVDLEPWHVDNYAPLIKTFLYLSDVSEESGPLRVMPGSHLTNQSNPFAYKLCRGGQGALYHDQPTCRRLDREGRMVLGKAGTLTVFDIRGTHAGSLCRRGYRVALVTGFRPFVATRLGPWDLPDPVRRLLPWEKSGYQAAVQGGR
jgi:Phytanoyl-CoA dioxygenase (PhyH)